MELQKTYNPADTEKKWYQYWEEKGFFTPTIDKTKKPYTILIPPPNVTGILHMGHVLNNTIQDTMIRYKRMTGVPTLWLPGVDHAGIATQNVVEKLLAKEGKTRYDIGREALLERIWQWKNDKGGRIIAQLKKLGASCDWTRQRFTMDDGLSEAVKEVFTRLYKKGLVYRGKYIINWCPHDRTALANDEVDHEDETGNLWHIRYPFAEGEGYVTVATTRPETMFGDVAVAVNPADERYQNLIGKQLVLPLTDKLIPVIADDYVDKEFGSGCVKITPAHDPNDFEVGNRHNLPRVVVMDEAAIMNENAPAEFVGLTREEARKKTVEMLKEQGLLEKIEPHNHAVGHCYRCGTVIEPYLSDQWFVKMKPMAEPAIEAAKTGKVKFMPQRWEKVYLHWMENIRDWCISRQIWWGHRIPAWYCDDCGKITVATTEPTACEHCGSSKLRQDENVLDTWFSSWLWPFSTLGWPNQTEDLAYFMPSNLLVTAPGIIYLWVARMIMSTIEFCGEVPFPAVYLHGMVLDEQGRKMSKSLGNSPDPIDVIDEYGADALRFGMIFNTPKGADSYYSNHHAEIGRNFANKIWNAFRFIYSNAQSIEGLPKPSELKLELADKWIYSRLHRTIAIASEAYEAAKLSDAAQAVMDFIWNQYCSWYLELAKDRIYNSNDAAGQLTAKYVLLDVLQNAMRLLHPLMPFISEELFQQIKEIFPLEEEAIIIAKFPTADSALISDEIEESMSLIQDCISAIRNLRKENGLPLGSELTVLVTGATEAQKQAFNTYYAYFSKLAKVEKLTHLSDDELLAAKPYAANAVGNLKMALPLAGMAGLDVEAKIAKTQKEIGKLEKEIKGLSGKLKNPGFVDNAPANVVERERQRLQESQVALQKMQEVLNGLQ